MGLQRACYTRNLGNCLLLAFHPSHYILAIIFGFLNSPFKACPQCCIYLTPLYKTLPNYSNVSFSATFFRLCSQPKYILAPLTPTLFFFINSNYNYLIILQLECKVQKSFKVCIVFHCKFNF